MRRRTILATIIIALLLASATAWAPDEPKTTVVINEICWAGSSDLATAEWIELVNTTESTIDLTGWELVSSDGAPHIRLQGTISPRIEGDAEAGYFLLERDSDNSAPGIQADLIYHGALTNLGESLFLIDPDGRVIDTANAPLPDQIDRSWPAGSDARGTPPFASMERISFNLADEPANWASCIIIPGEGTVQTASSTPRSENSVYNVPPVARISISPPIPRPGSPAEFSATDSTDSNDPIESYHWAFGDGTEATEPTVPHTYDTAGNYQVILTLTDTKGGATQLTQTVSVALSSPPLADFSVLLDPEEDVARSGSPITFQDESSDMDSSIVMWEWQFGDGNEASGRDVTHAYATYGEMIVGLRVTDAQGEVGTQTRSLSIASQRPVARFAVTTEQPSQFQDVVFDASESFDPDGEIVSYLWDFDNDGTIDLESSEPISNNRYDSAGDVIVRLFVRDDQSESSTDEQSVYINAAPIAQFKISDFEPTELDSVLLTDLSSDTDGLIAAWLWDFGDGNTSCQTSPSHIYQTSGTLVISLTVTDDMGAISTTEATIHVANLPPIAELSVPQNILPTGSQFTFDASASTDPSPQGNIQLYEWSIDGGSTFDVETSSSKRTLAFDEDGSHVIRVRITDSAGAIAVSEPVSITVTNRAPTISQITRAPDTTLLDGDEVTFTAHASDADGEVTGWVWTIDSGTAVTAQQLVTAFEDDGFYEISLQVRDNDGALSDVHTVTVPVSNAAPVADFTAVQGSTCGAASMHFDASASYDPSPHGQIVHVAWEFGDGTSCPGSTAGCANADRWAPEHCYSEPGTYIVTLVVIDEHGAMSSTQKTILIAE